MNNRQWTGVFVTVGHPVSCHVMLDKSCDWPEVHRSISPDQHSNIRIYSLAQHGRYHPPTSVFCVTKMYMIIIMSIMCYTGLFKYHIYIQYQPPAMDKANCQRLILCQTTRLFTIYALRWCQATRFYLCH
jgi:hypothetical protein